MSQQPADKPDDLRFCRICQHCQHYKLDPPPSKAATLIEGALIRATEGANPDGSDDRPQPGLDGKSRPFMSGVFAYLAQLTGQDQAAGEEKNKPEVDRINNHVIRYLYEAIPHPAETTLGERFRRADGSWNNIFIPSMGQAGLTYARTCQSKHIPIPPAEHEPFKLPKPTEVFDKLLRAPTKDRDPHPGGNSALTFAFASIVTHTLFRTDPRDWNKNLTSSYLDLSPLYGSNQEEQDAVRMKEDGRGYLHPDTFSESRMVFLPPAAAALLVVYCRNHNYIAQQLLKNEEEKDDNERTWYDPPPIDAEARRAQDEEIFQTARLINCAAFMSTVLNDYVAGFLGVARYGSTWNMEPFNVFRDTNHQPVGRGKGNQVSVEFNLLYRWHSVVSSKEQEWTNGILKGLYPNKEPRDLTMKDFYDGLGRLRNGNVPDSLKVDPDPRKRNFGGIVRGPSGRFNDEDLANILHNATDDAAHRYGARGAPEELKVIEIMGMLQARKWGACTMNEFRERMGLEKFKDFDKWNPNPEIVAAAKELYGHIDNLELYPGLHAEDTMPLGPGSGLCAGYTITRGILSDAIALVRGDRFFTTDFTSTSLTPWGFADVQRNPKNGAFGAYLPKLLIRNLPKHYPENSIYSLFPFFTPSQTKKNLEGLQIADKYDFKRPGSSQK